MAMSHVAITLKQAASLMDRAAVWMAEWRALLQEARRQAELRRKLSGVDSHLLRDMGLVWTGRHFERIDEGL